MSLRRKIILFKQVKLGFLMISVKFIFWKITRINLFVENEKNDKKKFVKVYRSMEFTYLAVDFPVSSLYKAS